MTFNLNEQIMPILDRFRLGLLARLGTIRIDHDLITAVVERWRRETHSFHFPTGECTITLQDVTMLWGLPINGAPIIGPTSRNWSQLVLDSFGRVEDDAFRRPPGTFHLSKEWLRQPWQEARQGDDDRRRLKASLPPNSPPIEVERYARAFMLDLCSSVMFPDQSGFLQTMFLQFFQDIEDPPQLSWASGVLARLYRALCDASDIDKEQIGGPLMLLQMWVWTRFPIGRPRAKDLPGDMPYGVAWMGSYHDYEDEPHRSVTLYRYLLYNFFIL